MEQADSAAACQLDRGRFPGSRPLSSTPVSPHLASRRIILILAAMVALETMAIDLYAPAFPALQRDLAVSPNAIQATLSMFLLGSGVAQVVLGPLLDTWGRRKTIIAGAACFTLGSFVCAIAPDYRVFMLGRLIQSFGAAASAVAPRAVIADVYAAADLARMLSIVMQIMMIAPVISPVLGAFLLTHFGWRANFHVLTLAGAALWVLAVAFLPETLPAAQRHPAHPSQVLAAYRATVSQYSFFLFMVCGGLAAGSLFSFLGAAPFAFIDGYHMRPTGFSVLLAAMSLAFVAVGGVNLRLLRHLGAGTLVAWGLSIQLVTAAVLIVLCYRGRPEFFLYAGLSTTTLACLGLVLANVSALAMAQAGTNKGVASAALGITQSLFGAASGLVLALTGTDRMGMMAAISLFAALALLSLHLARRASLPRTARSEPAAD